MNTTTIYFGYNGKMIACYDGAFSSSHYNLGLSKEFFSYRIDYATVFADIMLILDEEIEIRYLDGYELREVSFDNNSEAREYFFNMLAKKAVYNQDYQKTFDNMIMEEVRKNRGDKNE